MAEAAGSSSPDAGDRDFEPSAELLIHDYDDEGTLEEEENLSSDSGDNDEINDLQKEGDMPLEDLLAMYGYGAGDLPAATHESHSHSSTSEEEILNNHDLTLDKEEVARDILKHDDGSETSLEDLMENVPSHNTLTLLNGLADADEDEDYIPTLDEEVWKKNIQVGDEYQATIPDLIVSDDHSSAADTAEEKLLWDPNRLDELEVTGFLMSVNSGSANASPTRNGSSSDHHPRLVSDDEQALYALLLSNFNVDVAVKKRQTLTESDSTAATLSSWSEDECQSFESGLRVYGKNFFAIQQNKVKTRSVGELVQFYYFWKKTERREAFCNRGRIEKKKFSVQPGVTDYIDRFGGENADEEFSPRQSPDTNSCHCEVDSSGQQLHQGQESEANSATPEVSHRSADAAKQTISPLKRSYSSDYVSHNDSSGGDDEASKRIRVDNHSIYSTATEVGGN